MSKGLEALNKIKDCLEIADEVDGDIVFTGEYEEQESLNIIEKELKALEIIKNKGVDISLFKKYDDRNLYNYNYKSEYQLTQKEYDLLKEVLL